MNRWILFFAASLLSMQAYAKTIVLEGADAEQAFTKEKTAAIVLVQKNKEFILRTPDGKETAKPEMITVKAGQRFYIVNEEHEFVHNVYDETDSSWVLKKQQPSGIAAIAFDTPGRHNLRCAIHPTMKTAVEVTK